MFWNYWRSQSVTLLTCYKQHKNIVKMLLNQNWRWFETYSQSECFDSTDNSFQYNNVWFGWWNRQYIGLNTISMRVICTIMLPDTVERKGGCYLVEWCHLVVSWYDLLLVTSTKSLYTMTTILFFSKARCNTILLIKM